MMTIGALVPNNMTTVSAYSFAVCVYSCATYARTIKCGCYLKCCLAWPSRVPVSTSHLVVVKLDERNPLAVVLLRCACHLLCVRRVCLPTPESTLTCPKFLGSTVSCVYSSSLAVKWYAFVTSSLGRVVSSFPEPPFVCRLQLHFLLSPLRCLVAHEYFGFARSIQQDDNFIP